MTNEVYTGNLIQNQTGSRSYKDDTMIYKPESEWIRHEALHEAIISPEVWNEVQAINRERTLLSADNAPPKPFLFTGKLVCADCKAPFRETGDAAPQERHIKKYVSISAPVIRPPATARAHGTPSMKRRSLSLY